MADTVTARLFAKFGGQTNLARALGINQSTVSHWAKTGMVPTRWHSKIIQVAADQGLNVAAGDLVSTPTLVAVRPTSVPVALVGNVLTVGDEDETASVHC